MRPGGEHDSWIAGVERRSEESSCRFNKNKVVRIKLNVVTGRSFRTLAELKAAADELPASKYRVDSGQQIDVHAVLLNVAECAKSEGLPYDAGRRLQADEQKFGGGSDFAIRLAASIPLSVGKPISIRTRSGCNSLAF